MDCSRQEREGESHTASKHWSACLPADPKDRKPTSELLLQSKTLASVLSDLRLPRISQPALKEAR